MNRRQRLVRRFAPFYGLWLAQRRHSAHLADRLAESERLLAITRAHLTVARDQADRALAIAMATEWSADDAAFLREMGVEG